MITQQNLKSTNEQIRIINHLSGAILVLAPVGTGKTHVLAERAVHAVQSGIPAKRILCLTFTNRAAREMRERLARYSPDAALEATIKTFHGLCAHMLRAEARQIGLPADFVIYDDIDSLELVKESFGISKDRDAKEVLGRLAACKTRAVGKRLALDCPPEVLYEPLGASESESASCYQEILRQRHALDFADLIYYTRAMLHERPDIRQRWEEHFGFIQVDEVQDTHMSEYDIVRILARRSGNIALIGDIDQTIYGWRGSQPERVIDQFEVDFAPARYSLTLNYRATRILLEAVDSFANSFSNRYTNIKPAERCTRGKLIQIYHAADECEEGKWIGRQIHSLSRGHPDYLYNRIAVLTRTNKRSIAISNALQHSGIPHITVEQYEFFRRQEIKDALAYLRLLINPHDTSAMHRILLRPARGIGNVTVSNLITGSAACGLRLTDMALSQTFGSGDPFGDLLNAYSTGEIVVFDVETTGLSVSQDEVIELAATRLSAGRPVAEFHTYIRNTVPVGDSEHVHRISDEFLTQNGRPAVQALSEFLAFADGVLLVGHNVGYDIKMVTAHAHRVDLIVPKLAWADTWNLAERFVETSNYRLETLAAELGLSKMRTHRADADVQTTIQLLDVLIPKVAAQSMQRRALVTRYGKNFVALAHQIDTWKDAITHLRPAKLLEKVLRESGLAQYYRKEPRRLAHLTRLVKEFHERDEKSLHPETALRSLIEFTALAKNVDYLSDSDNQVVTITIHQAKGLEFETVFIAGAAEDELPHYYNQYGERLEEERRLFYVAMTRAKQRLFISGYARNTWGHEKEISPFIDDIEPQCVNYTDYQQIPF